MQQIRNELMFAAFPPDGDEAGFEEGGYAPQVSAQVTTKVINDRLTHYNESNAVMNIVLLKDAIEYLVRISREIISPNGHMLLVGLGGSGKQNLTRFAAILAGYSCFQITLANNYGVTEFQADLVKVFTQA
jgi:dynein heavy chain